MKTIGLFLIQIKDYLILSLLIVISFILIVSNDNTQVRFLRAVAVGFVGTVQSGVSAVPNVFEIQKENEFLREKNIELSNEISALKEAKLENIRLTKILTLKDKNISGVVIARIVNKSLIQARNTITLNVGETDSIKINMPVITDNGLVGRVVSTSKNYSIAQILYNRSLNITVKVQRSRVDGILNYDGAGNLIISNVPKSADVKTGDVIITSEYSNYFPAGIPVGSVLEEGNLDNLFKKIIIKPLVSFSSLEEVFVLRHLPDMERLDLENAFLKKQ
ncbi:MAG: rod shape-determining protein MreC [Ignavibacteria bacterium]|jgi:rod shape-determining protein MreC|nr:rod shape-determining protein MreC [Ignavibacteria bacterium]MBK7159107.1 rod shape-determining protein MreC [Ignavibacteria bacterium]MBK7254122.1 rod shape-determining protein MreC [Ignavibacteria bacterium]MBK7446898.1 rod shape-determining protein MreC [Ignavibacteria bacterium]MBK8383979.1 rod shape-determining protein MreC [Ignavibacteria bacterium]